MMTLFMRQKRLTVQLLAVVATAAGKSARDIPFVLFLLVGGVLFIAPDTRWLQAWQELHLLRQWQVFQGSLFIIKELLILSWEISFTVRFFIGFRAAFPTSTAFRQGGACDRQ